MESNISIPDNRDPRRGDRVKADDIASIHDSIRRLRNRIKTVNLPALPIIEAPFIPSLRIKNGTTDEYEISVSRGLVIEKRPSADDGVDALIYWEASNALTDDVPTWIPIAHNESIFAVVTETNTGTIRPIFSVELEVLSSSTISTAYIPAEQYGIYYYEIAAFTVVDSKPVIERWAAGSHIFHEVANGGWWGELQWNFYDIAGGGSNESHLVLTIEDGKIVNATGTNVTGDGTIASLGTGIFDSRDTDI